MAGLQLARDDVRAEGIAEWMERRRREVAGRGPEAELAGRAAWAGGGILGEFPYAPRPSDVVTLGARSIQQGRGAERSYAVAGSSTFRRASNMEPTGWTPAPAKVRSVGYQPTATATAGPRTPNAGAAPRPTPEDEMIKLRREQAAFKDVAREESSRNRWMAIPALAPMAVPLLAEGGALLAGRAASQFVRTPLNLLGRETGLTRSPLTEFEKSVLRAAARKRVAQANGVSASELAGEVHHRVALRFAHLFRADPNRLANLVPLMREAHVIASRTEAEFVRALAGRTPTQAEVMAHAMRLDKIIEPYVLRAGVARPPPIP